MFATQHSMSGFEKLFFQASGPFTSDYRSEHGSRAIES